MSRKGCFLLLVAAMFPIAAAPAANAAPPDDACALLTTAQISSAATVEFGDGTYVTPTFKNTCTWTIKKPVGKTPRIVTLFLPAPASFEFGKKTPVAGIDITPVSGVGDDAYYSAIGTQVVLMVKKGATVFKMSVYGDIPMETKQAMEKTLAQQVVAHL